MKAKLRASKRKCFLSVVSPVYRAESLVGKLVAEIDREVSKITDDFEIILVEDGGPDNSWQRIKENCAENKRVKGIRLSRNFGQQYAIRAGLDAASGDWVVVMDCDLQDKPSEIRKLYDKAQEGYDIVLARRTLRQDGSFKLLTSDLFSKAMSYLTDTEQDSSVANFVLYSRKAVDALARMTEVYRYYPMMVQWIGFRLAKVDIEHAEREEGTSSYSFKKRLNLAIDALLSFSEKPLRLAVKAGAFLALLSLLAAISLLILYFTSDVKVAGWASLMVLTTFFSGAIILVLGIVGLYVGKIFEGVKGRPSYLIDEFIDKDSSP